MEVIVRTPQWTKFKLIVFGLEKKSSLSGIYRDKTMADKLMYIPNDDKQNQTFCRLQLVIETFGHSTLWTNELKFNKSPKSCSAKE